MTVQDLLTALQTLPWDAELLAFEAGCEDYCARGYCGCRTRSADRSAPQRWMINAMAAVQTWRHRGVWRYNIVSAAKPVTDRDNGQ